MADEPNFIEEWEAECAAVQERKQAAERADLDAVLKTLPGRRVLARLIDWADIFEERESIPDGPPEKIQRILGNQDTGKKLLRECNSLDDRAFTGMKRDLNRFNSAYRLPPHPSSEGNKGDTNND